MRWLEHRSGERRTRRVFLFLPLTLNGETRWLEWARIEQVYMQEAGGLLISGTWNDVGWWDERLPVETRART